jgi:monoamine oxidase
VWDVVVVGGGVAGLAAAGALARDRRVLLLEARDRFGGRVDTRHEPDWPLPIEAGAEFIHGRPPILERLCRRAGVRRLEDPERHFTGGPSLRPATHAWKQAMEVIGHLPTSGPDRSYDALARERWWRRLANRKAQVLARQFVEGFNAAPAADISAVALGQQTAAAEKIDGDRLFRPDPRQGGYRRIVDRLIDDVIQHNGHLRLSSPALRISWRRGSVAITTPDGVERARRAVITLPAGVLQASPRLFSPSLPVAKRRALGALRMGPVVRILLRFRRLPTIITRRELTFLHVPGAPVPTFWREPYAPVLVGWAAGPAHDRLPPNNTARLRAALASLARGLGISTLEVDGHRIFDWHRDPLARGAYTYLRPGHLDAPACLAAPVEGTLFFAGEATHTAGASGTVHGAIETGLRAASELKAQR